MFYVFRIVSNACLFLFFLLAFCCHCHSCFICSFLFLCLDTDGGFNQHPDSHTCSIHSHVDVCIWQRHLLPLQLGPGRRKPRYTYSRKPLLKSSTELPSGGPGGPDEEGSHSTAVSGRGTRQRPLVLLLGCLQIFSAPILLSLLCTRTHNIVFFCVTIVQPYSCHCVGGHSCVTSPKRNLAVIVLTCADVPESRAS